MGGGLNKINEKKKNNENRSLVDLEVERELIEKYSMMK